MHIHVHKWTHQCIGDSFEHDQSAMLVHWGVLEMQDCTQLIRHLVLSSMNTSIEMKLVLSPGGENTHGTKSKSRWWQKRLIFIVNTCGFKTWNIQAFFSIFDFWFPVVTPSRLGRGARRKIGQNKSRLGKPKTRIDNQVQLASTTASQHGCKAWDASIHSSATKLHNASNLNTFIDQVVLPWDMSNCTRNQSSVR